MVVNNRKCHLSLGIIKLMYIRCMIRTLLATLGVVSLPILLSAQCVDGRYRDMIFPMVSMTTDVEYGSNLSHNGTNTTLLLDVFEPQGDIETLRPLVIMAHGGFFVSGSKEGIDIVPFCNDLARMGYVTASINYRLGFPGTLDLEGPMTQAVMRGVQDMRAAVRYFRKTVAMDGNPFGIDPDQIYIGGLSAGGFITLHYAYMEDDEIPSFVNQNGTGLAGGIEGQSGHPEYDSSIRGIISIAGAIGDSTWIDAGGVPAVLAHGTGDTVVPFDSDMLVISGFLEVTEVDGSNSIDQKMTEVGIEHCFEIYEMQGHVPSVAIPAYYDTTLSVITNFLSHMVCPEIPLDCSYREIMVSTDELAAQQLPDVFPIPANQWLQWNNASGITNAELINAQGQRVAVATCNGANAMDVSGLANGVYILRLHSDQRVYQRSIMIAH
jgi:para-nitrobenzyl esterase